jgi:hypothetical protein
MIRIVGLCVAKRSVQCHLLYIQWPEHLDLFAVDTLQIDQEGDIAN